MKKVLIRKEQMDNMGPLLIDIELGRALPGALRPLRPKIDDQAILRVQGRLFNHKRIPRTIASPPILPASSKLAKHFVYTIHANDLEHTGGKGTLMAEVRKQMWVLQLDKLVKDILKKCPHCQRRDFQSESRRPLPPLDTYRLPEAQQEGEKAQAADEPSLQEHMEKEIAKRKAFDAIGIDHMGPYKVKMNKGRGSQMRYVLVIGCLATRATNLELVTAEDTYSTRMALERHVSLFGKPRYINSDGAGCFRAVKSDLETQERVTQRVLEELMLVNPTLKWVVNPPYSPRFSGHTEALVKIARKALTRTLPIERLVTEEQMLTLVKKVMGFMNLRPLNEPSNDPSDKGPLCPADFLGTGSRYLDLVPLTRGPELVSWRRHMQEA